MQQYKAAATLILHWNSSHPQRNRIVNPHSQQDFSPEGTLQHTHLLITMDFKQGPVLELHFELTCSATDILLLGSTSRPSNLALTRFHTLTA